MGLVTKKCLFCGEEFTSRECDNRTYCSCLCSNRARGGHGYGDFDETLEWKQIGRYGEKRWRCPYTENVSCSMRKCGSCGWNPKVAQERLAKFMGGGDVL